MIDAGQALERLREGNRRFSTGEPSEADRSHERREEVAGGQAPFTIVLGCSDSRVPPETLFDAGLGDLFVIRVAGNTLGSAQTASIEFAALNIGSPLIVVLGHSRCGAVNATAAALADLPGYTEPNPIVEVLRPIMEPLIAEGVRDDLIARSVRANVRAVADTLRRKNDKLAALAAAGKLLIVGAEYDLDTGTVDFFDGAE